MFTEKRIFYLLQRFNNRENFLLCTHSLLPCHALLKYKIQNVGRVRPCTKLIGGGGSKNRILVNYLGYFLEKIFRNLPPPLIKYKCLYVWWATSLSLSRNVRSPSFSYSTLKKKKIIFVDENELLANS